MVVDRRAGHGSSCSLSRQSTRRGGAINPPGSLRKFDFRRPRACSIWTGRPPRETGGTGGTRHGEPEPLSGDLRRLAARPGGVLGRGRRGDRLGEARHPHLRPRGGGLWPLVRGGRGQCLPQCRRPPRRGRRGRAGGDPVRLARHRHQEPDHLCRASGRGRGARRRAPGSRRRARRPGGALHADGARGAVRHAGLRPHRRRAFRGVSGALPPASSPPGSRTRRPRWCSPPPAASSRPGSSPTSRSSTRPAALLAQARILPDPATAAKSRRPGRGARPRLGRGCRRREGRGPRRPLRAGRRHRSALRALHLGHDRQAEGRGARHRRLPRGPRLVDAEPVRRRPRRDLLVRLRCRLGGGPFLHRLRAADPRLHHGALRGQAGRHAGCRRVLARHRRDRGGRPVHRADGAPGGEEGGPGREGDAGPRPLAFPHPVPRRRAGRSRHRGLGRADSRSCR